MDVAKYADAFLTAAKDNPIIAEYRRQYAAEGPAVFARLDREGLLGAWIEVGSLVLASGFDSNREYAQQLELLSGIPSNEWTAREHIIAGSTPGIRQMIVPTMTDREDEEWEAKLRPPEPGEKRLGRYVETALTALDRHPRLSEIRGRYQTEGDCFMHDVEGAEVRTIFAQITGEKYREVYRGDQIDEKDRVTLLKGKPSTEWTLRDHIILGSTPTHFQIIDPAMKDREARQWEDRTTGDSDLRKTVIARFEAELKAGEERLQRIEERRRKHPPDKPV
ncbi:Uncharacterised protein [uncultured archaeon]|nr:Uncharacterised protein [uncultured archaeon]